ncbi:type II secretion system F family protein [Candidatus Uhrbacteria bacterium]|nr:type II secretion system F family protein [Candidatus Uhrbacteria bacterium]
MSNFKKELVDFFKNVALMVKSGIPLNEAMVVLVQQSQSKAFTAFLMDIKAQLERGSAFSKALETYREQIGDMSLNIIKAGEINGTLDTNLKYLADIMTHNKELKQKINSALLYPKIVLGLTFFMGSGISLFVLPKLIPLFKSVDIELPLATKILLWVSEFVRDRGIVAVIGVTAVVILFALSNRIPAFRWVYYTASIRMPFFGKLFRNYQLALFNQIFGTLFKSGLTIKETLTATAEAMTNVRYKQALVSATSRLTAGVPLATILGGYPKLFPKNVIALIAVGEQSGKLEETFTYLSVYFENEVDVQTKQLPTLIEPLMLIFIGLVVGFIALAVISPIYELTSGISKK